MSSLKPLPFAEALAFWAGKIKIGPKAFKELSDNGKTVAFAVSRIAAGDELNTVYRLLGDALEKGTTFREFQAGAADILERRGWAGKNEWKARSIFDTNVNSALNAGQYQVLNRNRDIFPYWQYSAINDARTSDFCRWMRNRVFAADDPVWRKIWPPNHHSCRSTVIGLTADQVIERGLTVETRNPLGQQVTVVEGGETRVVTLSPADGFASNPGEVWLQTIAEVAREKVDGYPPALAALVLQELLTDNDVALLFGER